ncbi:MAG: thiol reductant ABC exporter subunit CydD [Halofilum sp. (in: g-proteobacteria)]
MQAARPSTDNADWLDTLVGPARGWLLLASGAGLLTGFLIIAQAGLVATIVHEAIAEERSPSALAPFFLAFVVVVTLRAGAQWLQQAAGINASADIRERLRARVLDRIDALGPVRLAGDHSAGLASQALEQVDAVDGYFARYRPQLVMAAGIPAAILITALTQDWIVASLLLAAAPLIPIFMAIVGMGAEQLNRRQFETVTRLAGHFLDRVRGLSTLRLFGRAEAAVDEVHAVADEYRRRTMHTLRVAFLSSAVLEFFASVAIATVAIYVGFGLLGYIEFGNAADLTLFSGLFVLLLAPEYFQPLRALAQHYHDRAAALGAAEGLREILERPGPASAPEDEGAARDRKGAIEIEGLTFAHADREPLFRDAALRVGAGERIAVVGPSGCGKSSLLQLLAGFIVPDSGSITIDGHAPGTAGPVAWIGQRPFLLAGTIRENIALARPEATQGEIELAAERAGVTAFTEELPDGLDTCLGEAGQGLSGGQGQRVALARAFLAPAPLILLDEPTAHLDASAEAAVLAALRELSATGRTLVIASHHPAVRAMVDRVVTMDDGRLREVEAR